MGRNTNLARRLGREISAEMKGSGHRSVIVVIIAVAFVLALPAPLPLAHAVVVDLVPDQLRLLVGLVVLRGGDERPQKSAGQIADDDLLLRFLLGLSRPLSELAAVRRLPLLTLQARLMLPALFLLPAIVALATLLKPHALEALQARLAL